MIRLSPDVAALNPDAAAELTEVRRRTPSAAPSLEEMARLLEAGALRPDDATIPENAHQRALILRLERVYPECAPWLVHTPNGGKRGKREAIQFAALGVKAGVPDLLLFVRSGGRIGWAGELKRYGERPRPEQCRWLEHLRGQGWQAGWFDTWLAAWCDVDIYLRRAG